jgi:hypothetical protein
MSYEDNMNEVITDALEQDAKEKEDRLKNIEARLDSIESLEGVSAAFKYKEESILEQRESLYELMKDLARQEHKMNQIILSEMESRIKCIEILMLGMNDRIKRLIMQYNFEG